MNQTVIGEISRLRFFIHDFQFDNTSKLEPVYPVMMKQRKFKDEGKEVKNKKQEEKKSEQIQEEEVKVADFFEVYVEQKLDVPKVSYYNMIEFRLMEMDVNLEFNHLLGLMDFALACQKGLHSGKIVCHQVFYDDSGHDVNKDDVLETRMTEA